MVIYSVYNVCNVKKNPDIIYDLSIHCIHNMHTKRYYLFSSIYIQCIQSYIYIVYIHVHLYIDLAMHHYQNYVKYMY